ncbi:MAG: EAL domain-containing protein [Hyphomicrobiales bacterium]|nr:MAG: EAL domain-containing protein [Hyphomicrobiales bacterium]
MAVALRPTNLIFAVAVLAVLGSAIFADIQNRTIQEQQLRALVSRQVSVLSTRLEGNINGNMQLVRGLVATLVTEPGMGQTRFTRLASQVFKENSQLRNIAAAPNLKVTMVYPLAGNEAALGLDYTKNEAQRAAAYRARDGRQLIIAGPVDLVQGGQGFVGRFPVYTGDQGQENFWGIVSAVVDAQQLYADSGLVDPDLDLDVSLRGRDGTGFSGAAFFGTPGVIADRPVTAEVRLPTGSWQLAARPRGGWAAGLPNPLFFRLLVALASALIIVPLLIARFLIGERQKHIRTLGERERQLDVVSRRLGLALDTSEVGVWEYNIDTDTLVWDDRMNDLYGQPKDGKSRTYHHWRDALHPADQKHAQADFADAIKSRGRYVSEYRVRLSDGTERHIRSIGNCYRDRDGSSRIVGVNWDVTADVVIKQDLERAKALTEARNAELIAATARIEHTSLHDALTRLPNRRYLDRILEERAARCAESDNGGLALLHIDLDRFKEINDTLGHAAGDSMLVHVAEILRKNVREDDFVARIGGDEFVIVSGLGKGRRDLSRLATRIVEQMREPVPYMGYECRCGVSIGIAYQRGPKVDDKRLLMDADIALYRAKRRGRNRHEFFTEALQAEIVSSKQMADDILAGIEQGQFVAWYQPQVDGRTRQIAGVEALARWEHPTRGIVPPDVFLPIAEDLNVTATIDRMILEQTLAWMKVWRSKGLAIPHASVNVSGRRLRDENLIKQLRKLDIEPGTISFELVESIYLDERDDMVTWNIDQLRELGIEIEIDDFGTGYASIVSLLQLQPRRLKIDRQLVNPVRESEAQRRLIASIVDIGHSLGIGVIAEGVETEEHARIVTELECDMLQGYAISKPLSPDKLERFVAGWQSQIAAA